MRGRPSDMAGESGYGSRGVAANASGSSHLPWPSAKMTLRPSPWRKWARRNVSDMNIVIEDGVYIGCNVTVLAGVTIGKGAAIGAGSVVTRDIPPGAVAAGVPCRILRSKSEE